MDTESNEFAALNVGENTSPRRRGLQFSLRHLLILIVVLSVAFAVLFAFPNWLASVLLSIAATLLLVVLTACVVYGTGQLRAFCIGALFPAVLVWIAVDCAFVVITFTASRDRYERIFEGLDELAGGLRFASVTGWLMAIIAGVLAAAIRRRLTRG